jgi:uncharacterized membrane protein YedE/YeeE
MFEDLGLDGWTPLQAAVVLGLALGAAFGALAQRTRFCLRRGLAGIGAGSGSGAGAGAGVDGAERRRALALWVVALAAAMVGVQGAAAFGLIDLNETRFRADTLLLAPLICGGLMFGAGMVLTRGCASRLTVLAASGNLRAAAAMVVFAIAAHATMKGMLNVIPQSLAGGDWTPGASGEMAPGASWEMTPGASGEMAPGASWEMTPGASGEMAPGASSLPMLLGVSPWVIVAALAALAAGMAAQARLRAATLVMGVAIGALIPLGWVGTGLVLADDFDPIAFESLAFTRPAAELLFWTIAGTAIPAGFGVGFMAGVLGGAHLAARAARELSFESFTTARQTGRYLSGAGLMGVGGVMAGGCTLGAGLGGVSTLGLSAIVALGAIALGAVLTDGALRARARGARMAGMPAE